ncbi:uncharacterized protein LOC144328497 isoform X4 [Podarcis muralis]
MDRPRRTRGWKVSWKMLLLADFILSSCFLMTQAQDSLGRPFTTEGNSPESQTAVFTTEGVHRKSHGTPTQVISVTPLYENISPAQNVVPNSSSAPDQVYESLQHGDQNVYNELMFRQNPSEVPSVGSSP